MSKKQKVTFPDHFIPKNQKDEEWGLQFCKAIWRDYSTSDQLSLFSDRSSYSEYMSYAMGDQSITKYKETLNADESDNFTFLNINWDTLPIFSKFREIALARTKDVDWNVSATPIDPISKVDKQKDKDMKAMRILTRQELEKIDPSMVANSPVSKNPDEFDTIEELEVLHGVTYKHAASEQIEEVITFVLEYNDFDEIRNEIKRCAFDFGICGIHEEVDINGIVKLRAINPANIICSKVEKRDFSDKQYVGEIVSMSIADLAEQSGNAFSDEQLKQIANAGYNRYSVSSRNNVIGTVYNRDSNDWSVDVMNIEWISFNELVHQKGKDKRGNTMVSKSNHRKAAKSNKNHVVTRYKTVYSAKWIVGTDYIYDFKEQNYQKRKKSQLQETDFSYHIFAPTFDPLTGRVVSKVKQCIPAIDALHIAWYKLQSVIASARPKGISIEIGALEDVDLTSGGSSLTPYDIIDLYNKSGNLVYRRRDENGIQSNYLPINELNNGIGDEAERYYSMILRNIQLIRDITGLNEAVESFAGERTTSEVARLANSNSNNALHSISEADKHLLKKTYDSVLLRLTSIFQSKSNVNPFYPTALGNDTVSFIKDMNASTSYEFGITLEDKPDAISRERFLQRLDQYASQGLLEPEDIFMIENTPSLKKAQIIIAYKIKRRKEEAKQHESMMMQQQGQMEQQKIQMQMQLEQQRIEMQKMADLEVEKLKGEYNLQIAMIQAQARIKDGDTKSAAMLTKSQLDNTSREKQTVASLKSNEENNADSGVRSDSKRISDRTRNQSNR